MHKASPTSSASRIATRCSSTSAGTTTCQSQRSILARDESSFGSALRSSGGLRVSLLRGGRVRSVVLLVDGLLVAEMAVGPVVLRVIVVGAIPLGRHSIHARFCDGLGCPS